MGAALGVDGRLDGEAACPASSSGAGQAVQGACTPCVQGNHASSAQGTQGYSKMECRRQGRLQPAEGKAGCPAAGCEVDQAAIICHCISHACQCVAAAALGER